MLVSRPVGVEIARDRLRRAESLREGEDGSRYSTTACQRVAAMWQSPEVEKWEKIEEASRDGRCVKWLMIEGVEVGLGLLWKSLGGKRRNSPLGRL